MRYTVVISRPLLRRRPTTWTACWKRSKPLQPTHRETAIGAWSRTRITDPTECTLKSCKTLSEHLAALTSKRPLPIEPMVRGLTYLLTNFFRQVPTSSW